ncbi:receptor-like protein kinase FERONIA [Vicia villosa]|uniref:receptor-like protein kinase FERONIA n=1 Tax=Vicia villosa TaxID=3911 RepID=UPI00273C18BB|nr:receptor-like protein kinase FERONIA [Vicia villosa]
MANSLNNILPTKITLPLFVALFLLYLSFPLVVYSSYDILALNCGHSIDTTFENRTWVGDIENTKLFSITDSVKAKPTPNSDSVTQIPFTSARISFSNFTFSFPSITNGPVFLRLHFYPTSYQNFETSHASFTVEVGNQFTLLKDFNPSLWLQNDNKTIVKEYCIQVKPNESLNLTFIPEITNQFNAFAFINGIEIVSMPSFLYYTNLSDTNYHINSLGFGNNNSESQIRKDKALETVYRVSVGGSQVPSNEDTGMFRYWEDDYPRYSKKQYPPSISSDYLHGLNYVKNTIPNYTAPEAVYLTARTYGMNETHNYNVTWNFEVDSAFTYMVRLHFCEFDSHIKNIGDRVFQIFIANTLAEEKADVIRWSGGNKIPVHKDYAVTMDTQQGSSQIERVNLTIKLQRLPKDMYTIYRDVKLNGIEILKISDNNKNLAGSISKSVDLSNKFSTESPKKFKITTTIGDAIALSSIVLIIVGGVTIFWLRVIVVGIAIFWLRGRFQNFIEGIVPKTKNQGSSSLPPHFCRYFTLEEIKAATNNFDDVSIIGVGGFGNVYKGFIDRSTPVAIKRLKQGSQQGANEFMNEIELLSQLRHIHLVSLVGYCNDDTEMILVYEFMQHGTLSEYLYGSNNKKLPWKLRLEILLGAARGLRYLHAEVKQKIIHRDVKSTNILLDEKWVAKVSDFGLSKVGPMGISTIHVSTMVKGSVGYLDPEYYMLERLTLKSDVYSFGVVLLEVLCARPPLVRDMDKKTASLALWFQRCYDEGVAIEQIVDPFLRDSIPSGCLKCYCDLALSCLHDDGTQRPSMSQVVRELELALQLVMGEESSQFDKTQTDGTHMKESQVLQSISDKESCMHFTRSRTYKEGTITARPSTQEHFLSNIENSRLRSYSC